MMASKDDYIAFYSPAKDVPLAVSRETRRLLYMLARATNARTIIEFARDELATAIVAERSGKVQSRDTERGVTVSRPMMLTRLSQPVVGQPACRR
jgi:hypothetical protein